MVYCAIALGATGADMIRNELQALTLWRQPDCKHDRALVVKPHEAIDEHVRKMPGDERGPDEVRHQSLPVGR